MKKQILILSVFAEDDPQSGANRLRKMKAGLLKYGYSVEWLCPASGYFAFGLKNKLIGSQQLFFGAVNWLRHNKEGIILLSMPPPWISFVCMSLEVFWPKRVIVDFRDPILNQRLNPRGAIHNFVLDSIQRFILKRCLAVVVAAEGILEYLPLQGAPACVVLAGYEASKPLRKSTPRTSNKIKVIYGGSFYSSRSPQKFLEMLDRADPKFEFDFYVNFSSKEDEDKIRSVLKSGRLNLYPAVPYSIFMEKLAAADVGLIITHSVGSEYAIPGKIYDYISAGCVSWLISSDRALLDLVKKYEIPNVASAGMAAELPTELLELERLVIKCAQDGFFSNKIAAISSDAQTKIFVDFIEGLSR